MSPAMTPRTLDGVSCIRSPAISWFPPALRWGCQFHDLPVQSSRESLLPRQLTFKRLTFD
jgi:hypothetical protein